MPSSPARPHKRLENLHVHPMAAAVLPVIVPGAHAGERNDFQIADTRDT